ncbi:molybdopterin molybdotransferase MoeA [Hoyosella rhizosphaerae]|uniref:Molybdopterin molybdenumtransferase n=1 Tax=Hoyosella rhizosphaerae TaxID=1755582 RepID=A0A916U7M4_9ACTN|nr:gephyrin-like molybdotransferase Glp [Hoyosella rhizosphaerae]MBN4927788.1 molybdopterin molybdotransferase MoeA [Hoyosella rhizosphaerae]GGC61534.1 molybdopterin molybdenumtransferase [Hoyosella rhizosphaerae]
MRSVSEHESAISELLTGRPEYEATLSAAQGKILARDVIAPRPLPGFDNSAMDGYAVVASDIAAAGSDSPVSLPVAADIPAGRTDIPALEPGSAHRIMTGAAVPDGADAIVPVELTDGATSVVTINGAVASGKHIRRTGEDINTGEVALHRGQVLCAPQLGLLAALGYATVPIVPPMRVVVLSTGSELVAPGQALRHGEIYESNGIMLAAAVREAGGEAAQLRFVSDDQEEFLSTLRQHAADADLIITSGGVSAGAYEVVKDSLAGRGVEFVKVAMQPGMPQGCGLFEGTPIVTLPGNPVSALISFEVFLRPALRSAMGFADVTRLRHRARVTENIRSMAGKRQFRRGIFDQDKGTVELIGPPASHFLRWLALSNCLVEIPEDVTEIEAGTEVPVWDLRCT